MKEILLVNAPFHLSHFFPIPPSSLLSIASVLEKAGFDVGICDILAEKMPDETANPLTQKEFRRYIQHYDPKIVGISCYTENYYCALKVAQIVKEVNPNSVVIIGGAHVTFKVKETLQESPFVDFVVKGEGELTMLDLVSTIMKGGNIKNVKGIGFRANGRVVETENRPFLSIAELPPPSYHLVDLRHYGNGTMIECGRGCPFNCAFCSSSALWKNSVRFYPMESILNQIQSLLSNYDLKWLSFSDLTFTVNKKITIELLNKLHHLNLPPWSVQTRVDCISKEVLEKMCASNCSSIAYGIEDIHEHILTTINKHITFNQIKQAVKVAKKLGIKVNANFIVGLPGQTINDVMENAEFALKEIDRPAFPTLTPFPGSEIGENPNEFGLRVLNVEWSKYDLSNPIVETNLLDARSQLMLVQRINEMLYSEDEVYQLHLKQTDW